VEPDLWEAEPNVPGISFDPSFTASAPIQPIQTVVLDLTGGEEAVLARMKQKTRYNIHLAEKKEIVVQPWRDFHQFGQMMKTTSQRDGFGVHQSDYYRLAYEHFAQKGACELFCAQFQGKPLAVVIVFRQGRRAWYFYGASSNEERNRMPAYLVQWQAIRWAIAGGCTEYDLWGIPDAPEQVLEDQFTQRADGLWGVYRFKRGFGGEIKRTAGAFDRVYSHPLYSLYRRYLRMRNRTGAME
jgi:lipid II:glycine glycyltransferase (peptidoglycan interpeptide bridge formation enzyme)